jgi:hypothetical protein
MRSSRYKRFDHRHDHDTSDDSRHHDVMMVVPRLSRRGLRVTICPSRPGAVTIGSGLVDMIDTSRLGGITTGISDPCR